MNGKPVSMHIPCLGRSVLVCLLLWTAGCASKGAISGKVLYRGKPLPGGTVTFHLAGKGAFPVPIQEDGSYSLAQVPAGEAKITVETESMKPGQGSIPPDMARMVEANMQKKEYKGEMEKMKATTGEGEDVQGMMMPWRKPRGKYVGIPAQYQDPEKSGLTYKVMGGQQTHDIELK